LNSVYWNTIDIVIHGCNAHLIYYDMSVSLLIPARNFLPLYIPCDIIKHYEND